MRVLLEPNFDKHLHLDSGVVIWNKARWEYETSIF